MKLGIIGRGPWGDVYAKTLSGLGIDFWQAGLDWNLLNRADGVIIASAPESHSEIAEVYLETGVPVIIEKPVTMKAEDARMLLEVAKRTGGIAFTGHTRLYSTAWKEFKAQALETGVRWVYAEAGGPCKLDPWWDWGPHLVAMCLDLGFDPAQAMLVTTDKEVPLRFSVNDRIAFEDVKTKPMPLEVLIYEFVAAIQAGKPNYRGLELGAKVVQYLEVAAAGHRAMATPA